jgi:glycogen(starch) synthase
MRILMVSKTYPLAADCGGTGAMAKVIAEGLLARGHEVQLLASRRLPKGTQNGIPIDAPLILDQPDPQKRPESWTAWDKLQFLHKARHNYLAVREALQRIKPDLVYLNDIELLTGSVYSACVDAAVPTVWHAHDHLLYEMVRGKENHAPVSFKQRLLSRITRERPREAFFAAPVIAVSRFLADRYLSLGWPPERVQVVPNGIPDYFFLPRERSRSQEGVLRLLFVGRCVEDKGVYLLPELLELLHRRGLKANLSLVGEFRSLADQQEFQQIAAEQGLKDSLLFRGVVPREDMPALYAQADCLLAPSLCDEAFGLMSVEAQAVGTPVVAFKAGGLVETLEDGQTGFLCERGDVQALAECLLRLHQEEGLWERMSAAATVFASEHFRSEDKVLTIERILTGVVGSS